MQIRLPNLLGVALGKTDIMAVLFGLFIKFKSLHNSIDYFNRGNFLSQLNKQKAKSQKSLILSFKLSAILVV